MLSKPGTQAVTLPAATSGQSLQWTFDYKWPLQDVGPPSKRIVGVYVCTTTSLYCARSLASTEMYNALLSEQEPMSIIISIALGTPSKLAMTETARLEDFRSLRWTLRVHFLLHEIIPTLTCSWPVAPLRAPCDFRPRVGSPGPTSPVTRRTRATLSMLV
ncbi:hypothetical protein LshimejAT787_0101490 [Lyophyllum shimeji]|uniref:Uncharacterized protein n=1 Tax=Lyophyllum shimeji TaxID=47721 RepID=A0A9P3UJF2_LYOSH|nr:hypothetical protein LshimejAT787_0101490 [Lyophyllum shimeji]